MNLASVAFFTRLNDTFTSVVPSGESHTGVVVVHVARVQALAASIFSPTVVVKNRTAVATKASFAAGYKLFRVKKILKKKRNHSVKKIDHLRVINLS